MKRARGNEERETKSYTSNFQTIFFLLKKKE
jgi:hypothetical protein